MDGLESLSGRTSSRAQAWGFLRRIDWMLLLFAIPITIAGLVTMQSYGGGSLLFYRQLAWLGLSLIGFFIVALIDVSILKKTRVLVTLFLFFVFLLVLILVIGHSANGAQSWFSLGGFSIQPSDFIK